MVIEYNERQGRFHITSPEEHNRYASEHWPLVFDTGLTLGDALQFTHKVKVTHNIDGDLGIYSLELTLEYVKERFRQWFSEKFGMFNEEELQKRVREVLAKG